MPDLFPSWGRFPPATQDLRAIYWRGELPGGSSGSVLPRGMGRSYGDVCLNDGGALLSTLALDRYIDFDSATGLLTCEPGVTFARILRDFVPRGWFVPVTPGTKFVTVGGAIANDVHGKNHHRGGTLGRHVTRFELARSDGGRFLCSPETNPEWFAATIGGLGLTGLITWAQIRLKPIQQAWIDMESVKFGGLDEFFEITAGSDNFEYTVAWIDCLARGKGLGRGIFLRGNHAAGDAGPAALKPHADPRIALPFDFPGFVLNPLTVRAFNTAFYHKQQRRVVSSRVHYEPFFYPLDAIAHWNRMYGKRGFFQHQCVVPYDGERRDAIRRIVECIAASGMGSFLVILKVFGGLVSPGMLSFPRPGVTLALDFPNRGPQTTALLDALDRIVAEYGGAVNPSKDAHMSPEMFQRAFPRWREFSRYIDPMFSSSFWRRVTA